MFGWATLLQTNGTQPQLAREAAQWRSLWHDSLADAQVRPGDWPITPIGHFEKLTPDQLDPALLEAVGVELNESAHPGCMIEFVAAPAADELPWLVALADQPRVRPGLSTRPM